jgi:hypothetical protein
MRPELTLTRALVADVLVNIRRRGDVCDLQQTRLSRNTLMDGSIGRDSLAVFCIAPMAMGRSWSLRQPMVRLPPSLAAYAISSSLFAAAVDRKRHSNFNGQPATARP